jgi:hypothetical protein
MKLNLIAICVLLTFSFCKKDTKAEPEPVVPNVGNLTVSYRPTIDGSTMVFGTSYKNAHGDTFNVNVFKYYITNVFLVKDDGTKFSEGKFHLVDHSQSGGFTINGITPGTYKRMIYTLGVDSTRNVSGVQDGDLAPSKGMFWDWNTGYIFLKLEGTSPQADNGSKDIAFHIGGYAMPYSTIRTMTINFTQDLVIAKGKNPQLKLASNVSELFKNPYVVDFFNYHTVTSPGLQSNLVANNYTDMISFETIVP